MADEFELEAVYQGEGESKGKLWRKILPDRGGVSIGRAGKEAHPLWDKNPPYKRADWVIPFEGDNVVSGCHVFLTPGDGEVKVKARDREPGEIPEPLTFNVGKDAVREAVLKPGDRFIINYHVFTLHRRRLAGPVYLASLPMQAQERKPLLETKNNLETLQKLTRLLHEASAERLAETCLKVLLDGIGATGTAMAELRPDYDGADDFVLARRTAAGTDPQFLPSRTLLASTCNRRECGLAVWRGADAAQKSLNPLANAKAERDWAICVPVPELRDEKRVALYAEGLLPSGTDIEQFKQRTLEDFAGLLQIAARLMQSRQRSEYYRRLSDRTRPFLAGTLRKILEDDADEKRIMERVRPQVMEIASLIGDIRGSCGISEDDESELERSMKSISSVLTILTNAITATGGTVGGLQGDAAMGFWGWPKGAPGHPIDQAIAAIGRIREIYELNNDPMNPLPDAAGTGIQFGLGLAYGKAMAGVIGTADSRRADAFGPIVNLAARIEGMTKTLGVPVAADETVAMHVLGPHKEVKGPARVIWLGSFRPAGMARPIKVYELLPNGLRQDLDRDAVERWEGAMRNVFEKTNWKAARKELEEFEMHPHFETVAALYCSFLKEHDWDAKHPALRWTGSFAIDKAGKIHAG